MLIRFLILGALAFPLTHRASEDSEDSIPVRLDALMTQYCVSCHDGDVQKGDIRLDQLETLDREARLDLLNRIEEQVFFKHMPPEKKKQQPSDSERQSMLSAVSALLGPFNASKLEGKLQKPEYGNHVDHQRLFSGEHANEPGFTYDRRWLISEFIFQAKFNRMLLVKATGRYRGQRVPVLGNRRIREFNGLTNPFLLPEKSGVRYYANTDLTGGHLSTMLTNAQRASAHITDYLVKRHAKSKNPYLPAVVDIMALEDRHEATLAARREFLETHIARVCEDMYGAENARLLPAFVKTTLKEVKPLEEGETYKKAPIHVAQNMLASLGGADTVYQSLMVPEHAKKSDDEFRDMCERVWFYFGDHERKIQGRMTLLRDYLPDYRAQLEKTRRKIKPLVYKPLSPEEMETIEAAIRTHRQPGDHYREILEACMADWERGFEQERIEAGPPSEALLVALVDQVFAQVLERAPDETERREYVELTQSYIAKLGNLKGVQRLIQTLILSSEFVYRQEFGAGEPDEFGRRMMSPRDASYAIAYALTDQSPDALLAEAAQNGRLNTREDYRREVLRLLAERERYYVIDPILEGKHQADNVTNLPIRKLRFFREFFGYPKALTIFKDAKRFGGRLDRATTRLLSETDRLVEHILEKDQNVFEELLTTDSFYVYHDGDNERMQAASDRIKRIYDHFKDLDWKQFEKEDLLDHYDFLKEVKMRSVDPDKLDARNRQGTTIQLFKKSMTTITERLNKGQREAAPFDLYQGYGNDFMSGANVARFFNIDLANWDYATVQPAPVAHRRGMLTHPAWLVAHAKNTETDPIIRGKWIREKLLAGTIPEVPITVDASIPEDHHKTLRARLAGVTQTEYCWKCHERMNPLGYAFEAYDDFGRFRTEESLEHPDNLIKKMPDKSTHLTDTRDIYKTQPVDATGYLDGTGDEALDGEVKNAIDLAERLGKSERVRQSIIRHAFRYFLGRNEVLSDSKTLIDADRAYLQSGGSFDAVIVSLLTSDSFIYRKPLAN